MELPLEIFHLILANLNVGEIGMLSETGKNTSIICDDEYMWKKLIKRDYPEINLKNAKSIYQEIYKLTQAKRLNCCYFSKSYGYILQIETYETLANSGLPLRELHPTLFKKSKYYRTYTKYSVYDGSGFYRFLLPKNLKSYQRMINELMTCDDGETYLKELLMKDEDYYAGSMRAKVRFDMHKLIMLERCYKIMKKNKEIKTERYLEPLFAKMKMLGSGMIEKRFEKAS